MKATIGSKTYQIAERYAAHIPANSEGQGSPFDTFDESEVMPSLRMVQGAVKVEYPDGYRLYYYKGETIATKTRRISQTRYLYKGCGYETLGDAKHAVDKSNS